LPKELRRLSMELARVDALLDDPVFFAPFERFFDPRRGGSAVDASRQPQPGRIRHHQSASTQTEKLGLKGQAGGATPDGPRNDPSAAGCHAEAWPQHKRGP
jgi:hypothetical protein